MRYNINVMKKLKVYLDSSVINFDSDGDKYIYGV